MLENRLMQSNVSKTHERNHSKSTIDYVRTVNYYHGLIPKKDAESLLKKTGDFLMRKTETNPGVVVIALSTLTDAGVKHFMVNCDAAGSFYFEDHHENTINDLIIWHLSTKTPLTEASKAILLEPIERPQWLLNHDDVKLNQKLGEGAFGEVYSGDFTSSNITKVAIKLMKTEINREDRLKFMKEARLMRKYDHKNVIKILGVAVHESPIMLVMELCTNGSLSQYLTKYCNVVKLSEKQRFALDSAEGLEYLANKGCIHRDIAARNCLLSDKNVLKIADFGMSYDSVQVLDDTLEKVPIKWLAPETLQNMIFSLKTDVWSYGILVWEIFSNGCEPYPGLSRMETRVQVVVNNYRMKMPKKCPKRIQKLIKECWQANPDSRPDMTLIVRILKSMK